MSKKLTVAKIIAKIPKPTPEQAFKGLTLLVEAYKENHKVTKIEREKREQIQTMKEIEIEKIRQQARVLQIYLDKSFEERRENFDKMFDSLDKALEKNDIQSIGAIAGMIVEVAKTSPLVQAQKLISDYNNPDIDEIEI
jgi:hypothetical protein